MRMPGLHSFRSTSAAPLTSIKHTLSMMLASAHCFLVSASDMKRCPFVKDASGGAQALNLAVAASLSLNGESSSQYITPPLQPTSTARNRDVGAPPVIVCCLVLLVCSLLFVRPSPSPTLFSEPAINRCWTCISQRVITYHCSQGFDVSVTSRARSKHRPMCCESRFFCVL